MDITAFSSKRDTLQNTFSLHHGEFFSWDNFLCQDINYTLCMIKCVFHLCSKTKKKHLTSYNVTSVLCKDLVRTGMEGKRLLGGGQLSSALENFPRCCGHEVTMCGCTACKTVWAHWAVLKVPNPGLPSFYQCLVFQSKMAKLFRSAYLSEEGSVSH